MFMCKAFPLLVCFTVVFSQDAPTTQTYDYLKLQLQWTPSVCKDDWCQYATEHWTVHGLWPTSNVIKESPANCYDRSVGCSVNIKREVPEDLLTDMGEDWVSVAPPKTNKIFWIDEYCKHGTCCQNIPAGPGAYFEKTMELYDEIEEALDIRRLNSEGTHTFSDLNEALDQRATYKCETEGEVQYLKELGVCYNKDTLDREDCPEKNMRPRAKCATNGEFHLKSKPSRVEIAESSEREREIEREERKKKRERNREKKRERERKKEERERERERDIERERERGRERESLN